MRCRIIFEEFSLHDSRDDEIDVDFASMRCLVAPLQAAVSTWPSVMPISASIFFDRTPGGVWFRLDVTLLVRMVLTTGSSPASAMAFRSASLRAPFGFVGDEGSRKLRRVRTHIGFLQCFGRCTEMARCHMHRRAHGVPVIPAKRIEPQLVIVRVNSVCHPATTRWSATIVLPLPRKAGGSTGISDTLPIDGGEIALNATISEFSNSMVRRDRQGNSRGRRKEPVGFLF